jgi:hypothetical protein
VVVPVDGVPVSDVTMPRLVGLAAQPNVLTLEDDDLQPAALVDTITVIPGLVTVPGYDRMIANLRRWFGIPLRGVTYRPGVPVPADTDMLQVGGDRCQFDASAMATHLLERVV